MNRLCVFIGSHIETLTALFSHGIQKRRLSKQFFLPPKSQALTPLKPKTRQNYKRHSRLSNPTMGSNNQELRKIHELVSPRGRSNWTRIPPKIDRTGVPKNKTSSCKGRRRLSCETSRLANWGNYTGHFARPVNFDAD